MRRIGLSPSSAADKQAKLFSGHTLLFLTTLVAFIVTASASYTLGRIHAESTKPNHRDAKSILLSRADFSVLFEIEQTTQSEVTGIGEVISDSGAEVRSEAAIRFVFDSTLDSIDSIVHQETVVTDQADATLAFSHFAAAARKDSAIRILGEPSIGEESLLYEWPNHPLRRDRVDLIFRRGPYLVEIVAYGWNAEFVERLGRRVDRKIF